MTAMFPDSGVPYQDARNSLPDGVVEALTNCHKLWYSTSRCQPRFDPAAANAVLSEMINVIMAGDITYDCEKLDQVQLAMRYIIQRGVPRSALMAGGNQSFTFTCDPTLTGYNNFMSLVFLPNVNNGGITRVAGDGHALVPLYRNDGQELRQNDITAGHPFTASYWNGAFYMDSLVASQAIFSNQARYETPGSYTWICPTGVYWVVADVYSGGGGGGTGNANFCGGGGGSGGGYARKKVPVVPGTGYSVIVGGGGIGGGWPSGGIVQAGFNGFESKFASTVGASPGVGGNAAMGAIPGLPQPYAGIGIGGDVNVPGAGGSSGASGTNADGGYTGYGGLGGAAGGPEGGGGGAMSTGSAGTGVRQGGGGSGGGSAAGVNSPGGWGADGAVILNYVG